MNLYEQYINNLNEASDNYIILYHNTSNENAIKINKEGIIPGLRKEVYGKGSEAEGSGIWCSTVRGYGYGGATITFKINLNDEYLEAQNDTEYMVFRKIEPREILDIDLVISSISAVDSHNLVESDISKALSKYGKDKFLSVMSKYSNKFIKPYDMNQLQYLIETGDKYCKGTISLTEGVHLFAFVRDEDGNDKIIEDSDYSDKKSFKSDLEANGYKVKRINDEADMYIIDNSDYRSVSEVKTRIRQIERDIKDGIVLPSEKIELDNLKSLLSKVSNLNLKESNNAFELWKKQINSKSRDEIYNYYYKLISRMRATNKSDKYNYIDLAQKINYIEDTYNIRNTFSHNLN